MSPSVPAPAPGVWSVGGSLFVGRTGKGTLAIADGAVVRDSNGFVGQEAGSAGVVTVSGPGSAWIDVGSLIVGNFGAGKVTISNGGLASSRDGLIGDNAGSLGVVTVSGLGSEWTNSGDLTVATSGLGVLAIEDGGRVSNDFSFLGADTVGLGQVTVTGPGSAWANRGELTVGYVGPGGLSIQDGGAVSSASGVVGSFFDSAGSVQISGAGSSWTTAGPLTVGLGGAGALTLSDGGRASVQDGAGAVGLAAFAGSSGGIHLGAASLDPGDATEAGTLEAARVEFGEGAAALTFNHTGNRYEFNPLLISTAAGVHRLNQAAGVTVLAGDSVGFRGATAVTGGTLILSNRLGGAASVTGGRLQVDGVLGGPVAVEQAGVLAGGGTVAGTAAFANGGVLEGAQGRTLRFDGDLALAGTSQVNVALGRTAAPALFDVAGVLTLDGVLNVADQGGFGMGVYRLFNYQGGLTDNGMTIGATPSGVSSANLQIQTALVGQVNLVSTVGATLNFWDGGQAALHNNAVVDGGDGVWRATGDNWTGVDGVSNGPFQPNPTFAVFEGTGGTVTVDNTAGAIGVTGLRAWNPAF